MVSSQSESLVAGAYQSPMGMIVAVASEAGLRQISFDLSPLETYPQSYSPHLSSFNEYLKRYLRKAFEELPVLKLDPVGSDFERCVWDEIASIRLGHTKTYGEIARNLGKPNASRAVGLAAGKNPLGIVVPCHRVIGSKGSLTGYAGGVERKAWLLRHEGVLLL